ncbi:hypothetical protein L3X38_003958 [Prunus dulcis]|uniref:Transposable element protein n=1 Tax=Prunus dulcis TaxID=3755 RepID=A0AAD4ZN08_PRUDU|nr:hypothetical protein L3X38_003958 [Prunus dulcis]
MLEKELNRSHEDWKYVPQSLRKGSLKEHVNRFIDTLGLHAGDYNLWLREFLKALLTVPIHSIQLWHQALSALGRIWQASSIKIIFPACGKSYYHLPQQHSPKKGEDPVDFVHRFRDLALDCYDGTDEEALVEICISNIVADYKVYLKNIGISQFSRLVEVVRKTSMSVKPTGQRTWRSTDYRDLNRACPKDEFLLPNMDILIDSTLCQGLLSFMDGFSGYNQIKMSLKDAEKIAFRTPYGNFYYTRKPSISFEEGVGKVLAVQVEDEPKKVRVRVSSGKFLGFQVHQSGIDVDPKKTRAINSLAPPRNPKELKSFIGRLSYIRRFIPGLVAIISVFTPLLKKGKPYEWSKECQEAYQQVQQIITKLPTMRAPIPGLLLKLFVAATNAAVSGFACPR